MREKTNMKKVLMTTVLVTVGILVIGGTNSQAALQANATTHSTGKIDIGANWITNIRQMETTGQTMGLNEKIKADLTTDGESNNIDVHMMRSTEFGAMAILSASGFGWKGKLTDAPVKSTTGNVTGVYVMGTRWEWTAGVGSASTVEKNARYYDLYTTARTSAKVGDALGQDTYSDNPGCMNWHDTGGYNYWLVSSSNGFIRGAYGIFSYTGGSSYGTNWTGGSYCGRGVAVVGTGL